MHIKAVCELGSSKSKDWYEAQGVKLQDGLKSASEESKHLTPLPHWGVWWTFQHSSNPFREKLQFSSVITDAEIRLTKTRLWTGPMWMVLHLLTSRCGYTWALVLWPEVRQQESHV